ncbi:hypothetical protein CsatA_010573 [Cannabis sativa]
MAEEERVVEEVNEKEIEYSRRTGSIRTSTWTKEEDAILTDLVKLYNGKNWKKVASRLPNKQNSQCLHRWQKVLNPALVKGPWEKEEDKQLIKLVGEYGVKRWSTIAKFIKGRMGKQCRERSDNAIKNHWHCKVKKKMQVVSSQLYSPVVLHGTNNSNNNHTIEDDRVSKEVTIERHSSSKLFEGYDPNNNHNNNHNDKAPVPAYDEAHSASSSYCCYRFMRLLRMSAATFPNTPSIIRKSSRRN